MVKYFLMSFFLFVGVAKANSLYIDPLKVKDIHTTYGFVIGQNYRLELIRDRFPQLGLDVSRALNAFSSSPFGEGFNALEKKVRYDSKRLYNDSEFIYNKLIKQIKDFYLKEPNLPVNLTLDEAREFIYEVNLRAAGQLPDSIISTLLYSNPSYNKNPEKEFLDGWTKVFRTQEHHKSKGVDFSVSIPLSWTSREGNRPNIIQVFESHLELWNTSCNIMVLELNSNFEDDLLKDMKINFFDLMSLDDIVPEKATLINYKSTRMEGAPAGIVVIDLMSQQMDLVMIMRITQFMIIHNDKLVLIQFINGVEAKHETSVSLTSLQEKYYPLFRQIANSLVLNDRYH